MKVINRALCAVASGLCVALSFTACGSGGSSSTPPPAAASPATITTVAGTGTACTVQPCGDTGPATAAQLRNPSGVAVNAAGDLWIADLSNDRIRRVDAATGTIITVAGTGTACTVQPCGDTGPADAAQLFNPGGVAVDAAGDLWIADQGNHRIRRVDAAGIITTVAGTGTACTVQPCGDTGPADAAQLSNPVGVAVDAAGNFWIADQNNHRIRKVDAVTGTITTVAGTGTACTVQPIGRAHV